MEQQKYTTEFKAIQLILELLNDAPEDARLRIIRTVTAFFGIETEVQSKQNPITSSSPSAEFFAERSPTPKAFLRDKKPETVIERVACLAYFLSHYRDMQSFKTSAITSLNTEAAQPRFGNPSDAVANAQKAGFLASTLRGEKQLTADGETYVEALPDRSAARNVLRSPKLAKRSRKR